MPDNIGDGIRQLRRSASMRCLYPAGHPVHASALRQARESVDVLLGDEDRVDLVIAGGRLTVGRELLADEDGVIGELAARWWELGLCGLSVRQGATDEELDLLMTISAPAADIGSREIRQRLDEMGATRVGIVELDYDRFVPRSRVPLELQEQLSRTDIRETLRHLVEDSRTDSDTLDEEQRGALVSLLDHPEALAHAIEEGVLSGPPARTSDPASVDLSPMAETRAEADPTVLDAAGEHLARTLQRLACIGSGAVPTERRAVCRKLAEALRSLDPGAVAAAYRAASALPDTEFDALTEIAKCMSVSELVGIVRSLPRALASEPSAVYRRLLWHLSGGGDRLNELAPALRRALLEDGVSEDVYASTIGMALAELAEVSDDAGNEAAAALPVGLGRAPDSDRAERRAEIEGVLGQVFGEEAWAGRALLCLELLRTAQSPTALRAAAAGIRVAVRRVPDSQREDVWRDIALGLADLVDPRHTADPERRTAACDVIAQAADPEQVGVLLRVFESAGSDARQRIAQVLVRMGPEGLAGATSLLVQGADALGEEDVAGIVQALICAETEGLGGGAYVARVLASPQCKAKGQILRALMSEGGKAGRKWLLDAVRHGDPQLRWDITKSAGHEPTQCPELLEAALDDPDESVACAAVDYLGTSGQQHAGALLAARVRPFHPRDRRPELRLAVVRALGRLRYAEATEALGGVLDGKTLWWRGRNDALRLAAAEALVAIGTQEALQRVAGHARRERCARIRALAHRVVEAALPVTAERGTTDAT